MKKLALILAMVSVLWGCGDDTTFTAEGEVEELGTQNMRVVYCANGSTNLLIVPVTEGTFEFKGKIDAPTMLEFYSANKSLLGRAYVSAGDNIKCKLFKNSPYKAQITGNEVSQRWSKWLNENLTIIARGDAEKINAIVTKYINANKNDVLSTLLLLTEYDSSLHSDEAMKLLSVITPDARPKQLIESYEALLDRSNNIKARERLSTTSYFSSTDSLKTFAPHETSYSIVTFSNHDSRKDGELSKALRSLRNEYPTRRLQVMDISFDTDTTVWKKSIKSDSATWRQGWVAGAASAHSIERLGITRVPFFIVADSTGTQLYRGTSLSEATTTVKEQFNLK